MKAKYRKFTKTYMIKLRYITITGDIKNDMKALMYEKKAYKCTKQMSHLIKKFPYVFTRKMNVMS